MAIFEILNVGQGDSIVLRPTNGCCFKKETIIIDLGPGKYDITKKISKDEKVHIFFTHHDNDHLEGIRFFIGKMDQVKEITVPLYQNEITLIARAILNLKGINKSKDCNEFIKALEEIVNNQVIVKTLVEGKGACPKLSFAYEAKRYCNHVVCLNPPMLIETIDWIGENDSRDIIELIYEVFSETFAREMELFIHARSNGYDIVDSPELQQYWLHTQEEETEEINRAKCNYVLDFIFSNIEYIRRFNGEGTRNNLRQIYNNYVKCTHDVCIVLKTCYDNKKLLLTGDASKKVFNRLIREKKDISAEYLKVPHHGSRHNMNKKILTAINPRIAIISHDNGHFGKSTDTHPNQEILDLLQREHVKVLVTNDVIKNNVLVMKKSTCRSNYINIG